MRSVCQVLAVNTSAVFLTTQLALPLLRAAAVQVFTHAYHTPIHIHSHRRETLRESSTSLRLMASERLSIATALATVLARRQY